MQLWAGIDAGKAHHHCVVIDAKVRRAHELKARGLKPMDIGKIIGASRATVYRYLGMDS